MCIQLYYYILHVTFNVVLYTIILFVMENTNVLLLVIFNKELNWILFSILIIFSQYYDNFALFNFHICIDISLLNNFDCFWLILISHIFYSFTNFTFIILCYFNYKHKQTFTYIPLNIAWFIAHNLAILTAFVHSFLTL